MNTKTAFKPVQEGWIPPEQRTYNVQKQHALHLEKMSVFGAVAAPIAGTGEDKVVLLHEVLTKVHGTFPTNTQTIGDCVSHGWGKGVETLAAVEVILKEENEKLIKELVATEWIYGTSRVIQGGGRLGNGDGSLGSWASAAVKENGILFRKKYGNYDLREYSGSKAKKWGYKGLPAEKLEPTADEHPVQTTALVTTYEEARDAIASGYPVPVCSSQGFDNRRDSEGFSRPKGTWHHCMLFISVDDKHSRLGLLCINSWGEDWISGPKRHNQPEGSFWVDADTADRMLRGKDSYSISNFKGFPERKIDHRLW